MGYRSFFVMSRSEQQLKQWKMLRLPSFLQRLLIIFLEADPKLSYAMLQKMAYELGEASKTITFLAQKTVRERLAEVLLLLEQKLELILKVLSKYH